MYNTMIKWFDCPDGGRINIVDCLKEGGCRMQERCATRSYLHLVSKERKWTGRPSTTQLIRGTREAYLVLAKDYSISPDSRAFMAQGTKTHLNLELSTDEYSELELKFDGDNVSETGISDVVETEDGVSVLIDYKNSGSFKVAKALGFCVVETETDKVYKTGKRKGEKKKLRTLVRDKKYEDRWEWELQLNKYRIEYEKSTGNKITSLKIQCVVRDGNTYIARSRGVFRNIYYFKINIIPDIEILLYFKAKREALLKAVNTGWLPPVCNKYENWDGLKCAKYCSVADYCSYGKYLKRNKQSEDDMIKGLSDVRRLPRLGKIRLGIKKKTADGKKEYPAEVDYFILDPSTPSELENKALVEEFERLYGKNPKQIKIMIPLPDKELFFPQFYKRYGGSILKCKGNGDTAVCISEADASGLDVTGKSDIGGYDVKCNGQDCSYYKQKKCTESATLSVFLPELRGAGVWQITTGSFHSIVNLNSCLDMILGMCGRYHMVPLTLERREQIMSHDGKSSKHYPLHISAAIQLSELQRLATIDSTKILLELPPVQEDKEDILFGENTIVNTDYKDVLLIDDIKMSELITSLKEHPKITKGCFSEYLSKRFNCTINDIAESNYCEILEDVDGEVAILKYSISTNNNPDPNSKEGKELAAELDKEASTTASQGELPFK